MVDKEELLSDALRWLSKKEPFGILLLALAFDVVCVGAWILARVAVMLGFSGVN